MGPPFLFLSLLSVIMIQAMAAVGLPSYWWTYFVVPCVSVYYLCDHRKLSKELVRAFTQSFWGASISVAILSSVYMGYLPWNMAMLLSCIFCLCKSFSSEKMMFSVDMCGELVKSIWWRISVRLLPNEVRQKGWYSYEKGEFLWQRIVVSALKLVPTQVSRMAWNGDWAYCSPYSRRPQHKNIDFYYILCEPETREQRVPEPFDLKFDVEDCEVVCKYFPAARIWSSEDDGGTETTVPERREEHLAAAACVPGEQGASSSQGPGVEGVSSSLTRPSEEGESSVRRPGGAVAASDGSLLSETENVESPQVPYQGLVDKLEVSLSLHVPGGAKELESFTFFKMDGDRVVEIKRAMEVLKYHGIVIFSSFHRNIGSRTPRAHARCYEFEEIFELILNKSYTLQNVNLSSQHACSIGGATVMHILNTGLLIWMNYYQLDSTVAKPSLISVLLLFAFCHLALICIDNSTKLQGKRLLYELIWCVRGPNYVDDCYKYLQVKCPSWTFCNESFGHPYTSNNCQVICCFDGTALRATVSRCESIPTEDLIDEGEQLYNLRNVRLLLKVMHNEMDDDFTVHATLEWARNGELYKHFIYGVRDRRKITNLIAVLTWLEDNDCQGVCRRWEKHAMHAFTYEELLAKILDNTNYYEPWLCHFTHRIRIYVV